MKFRVAVTKHVVPLVTVIVAVGVNRLGCWKGAQAFFVKQTERNMCATIVPPFVRR